MINRAVRMNYHTNLLELEEHMYPLVDVQTPNVFHNLFPYTEVPKIAFNDRIVPHHMPDDIWITDTTFRDGQQSRAPYSTEQIVTIFDYLHKLGGPNGRIRQSEFFLYSKKDRDAVYKCLERGYKFPEVTSWIRASKKDFELVKDIGLKETGILVSCSDYHIFYKMKMTRKQAMEHYLSVIRECLETGISPRCHLEDITRADIYGYVIPFCLELNKLMEEYSIPIKVRCCDTMGYGVNYPGAVIPRSIPGIIYGILTHAGIPSELIEFHGHNDFYKAVSNSTTAWLYGASGVNCSLFGIGERTGNTPLEAMVFEYAQIKGSLDGMDTRVITELAEYYEKEIGYKVPSTTPFVGSAFNVTRAGIHADGLLKNEEIYNIFDTTKILNRSVPIIINDKAGRAGVAYWINQQFNLPPERQVSKKHPAVGQIHTKIMAAYEEGRNTSFSNKEIKNLVRRFMPELFDSEFDQMKRIAGELASNLVERLSRDCQTTSDTETLTAQLQQFVRDYSFIQYVYVTDVKGHSTAIAISDPGDQKGYKAFPIGFDYSNREWFQQPMRTGKLHIMNVHQSQVTGQLIITVSTVITDANDEIIGVLGADIQLEEIIRRAESLEAEEHIGEEE